MSRIIIYLVSLFIVRSTSKVISNCNNCKWFIPNINAEYGKCKMFLEKPTTVEEMPQIYNYAKHCRENESLCGLKGYLFEEKETENSNLIENRLEELKNIDVSLYEYANFIKKNKLEK